MHFDPAGSQNLVDWRRCSSGLRSRCDAARILELDDHFSWQARRKRQAQEIGAFLHRCLKRKLRFGIFMLLLRIALAGLRDVSVDVIRVQISWQALYVVSLEVQISWQALHFVIKIEVWTSGAGAVFCAAVVAGAVLEGAALCGP